MRILLCLLFGLACACGFYALAAVIWSIVDPTGAGKILLFTIPAAVAAAAVPALLGFIGMINLCAWDAQDRRRRKPLPSPRKTPRRTPPTSPAHRHARLDDADDLSPLAA